MVEETVLDQEPEVQKEETKEPNRYELEASKDGWRPLEEWEGNPDDWKDAKSFVRDGELFKKIEEVKRENKNLRKTVTTLKGHYEKVKETEYQRALVELKQAKKEALREGDTDLAVDLDDKIDAKREELENERRMEAEVQQEAAPHPEFVSWINRNKWYNTNDEAREFADNVGMAYKKTHLSADPAEVLRYVEEKVAKGYPDLFKNPRKNTPSSVEGGQGPRKPSGKVVLTDMETAVMKKLVRSGALTEEQYMKDIETLDKQGQR